MFLFAPRLPLQMCLVPRISVKISSCLILAATPHPSTRRKACIPLFSCAMGSMELFLEVKMTSCNRAAVLSLYNLPHDHHLRFGGWLSSWTPRRLPSVYRVFPSCFGWLEFFIEDIVLKVAQCDHNAQQPSPHHQVFSFKVRALVLRLAVATCTLSLRFHCLRLMLRTRCS